MATTTNPKIDELKARLELEPNSRLFFPLAEELRKIRRLDEAERVLREGIDHHPAYLSAWVSLGRVLSQLQKHRSAADAFDRALKLDPENIVAARLLAETYLVMGEKVEAIKKFKLVHAFLPQDQEVAALIDVLDRELNPHKFVMPEVIPPFEFVPDPPLEEPSADFVRSPVEDAFGSFLAPEPVPDRVPPLPPEMASFDEAAEDRSSPGKEVPLFAREVLDRGPHTRFVDDPRGAALGDTASQVSVSDDREDEPRDGRSRAASVAAASQELDITQEMPLPHLAEAISPAESREYEALRPVSSPLANEMSEGAAGEVAGSLTAESDRHPSSPDEPDELFATVQEEEEQRVETESGGLHVVPFPRAARGVTMGRDSERVSFSESPRALVASASSNEVVNRLEAWLTRVGRRDGGSV